MVGMGDVGVEQIHEITLYYAGQRLAVNGRLLYAWKGEDESDQEIDLRLYKTLKGHQIGGRYTIKEADDRKSIYPGTLRLRDSSRPSTISSEEWVTLVTEWTAQDREHRVLHEEAARRKRVAKEPDRLTELCAPLKELMRNRIGHTRRAALLAAIIEEVTG